MDDIDREYEIRHTTPGKNGLCPNCGMIATGFAVCPFCKGERKVKKMPRRWIGGVEIT